jgi:hypothetical protein
MKPRKIYYRRKGKSIIIEGKENSKSILIWTLPKPDKLLDYLIDKITTKDPLTKEPQSSQKESSYFQEEKWKKIQEKLKRLDIKHNISKN